MTLLETVQSFIASNPLSVTGAALGGGVLLQRFGGIFGRLTGLLSSLFSSQSASKIDELRADIAKAIADGGAKNLSGLIADLGETMSDLKDLLAGVKAAQPPKA